MHGLSTFILLFRYQIWTSKSVKHNRFRDLPCKRFLISPLKTVFDDVTNMNHNQIPQKMRLEMKVYRPKKICICTVLKYWDNRQLSKTSIWAVFAYSGGILNFKTILEQKKWFNSTEKDSRFDRYFTYLILWPWMVTVM